MNRQGPGKIEWTDYTLNIVTGCEYGCDYGPDGCYANKIAQTIYPEKFKPTFRPKGLKDKDLGRVLAGSKIFLSNMGDSFGDWVPDSWIEPQIELARKYPQYIFQFLTKNPSRYHHFVFPSNCWLGTTIDRPEVQHERWNALASAKAKVKFVSFEPLLGSMNVVELGFSALDWIIIGELTANPNHESHKYVRYWAEDIIKQAQVLDIPVFVKNDLGTTFPQREFPKVR